MKRALLLLAATLALAGACARRKSPAPVAAAPAAATASTPSTAGGAPVAPAAPDPPYELRMGRSVWVHYCQTCHGESGAGDGFNAFNLDPHPRDLSDPEFQKKKSDADLRDAVTRGGAGVGLSSLMPPWGRTLSPREVEQVLSYVRSLKRAPG